MSKSLGTLTLDLVANTAGFVQGMDKAERQSQQWKRQVSKDLDAIKSAAGVATAAISAATVALVANSVKSAAEISKLAQLSSTSFENFQRLAAGAQLAGVEQDKLGDILKDVNDKVGDFLQTGGGPMADFFENIAPKVGVTAEQFRELSGPDALQLYVSSLERANVSQNEMTFYMEAIASDATLLLPLLRDNGAGFRLLGDEAERAGAIMSEQTVSAADQLQATLFVAKQAGQGFSNQISEALLPTLSDLSLAFADVTTDGTIAADMGDVLSGAIKTVTATAVGAYAAIKNFANAIGAYASAVSFVVQGEFDKAGAVIDAFSADLDAEIDRYGTMLNNLWNAGEGQGQSETENRIQSIARLLKEAREEAAITAPAVSSVVAGSGGDSEIEMASSSVNFEDQLESLKAYREKKLDLMAAFDDREAAAKQDQQDRLLQIEKDRQDLVLENAESISGDLASITRNMAGEQSNAYRALFAVEKSFAIASSIVAVQNAIAKASAAAPFPANLGAMAAVASATAGLVSNISAVGMAHDGIDAVPQTGTWLLEKGERVVTSETSAKLDRTLEKIGQSLGSSRDRGSSSNIRIVNAFDTEVIGDYLASPVGEKVVMNAVTRNARTVKRVVSSA